jgi:hypothetical protein
MLLSSRSWPLLTPTMLPVLFARPKDRARLDIKNAPVRREMDVPEMIAGGADAFLFGRGVFGTLLLRAGGHAALGINRAAGRIV